MPALRELEERAWRAFLHGNTQCLAPFVVDDHIPAVARIQVYQNNAREGFTKAVAASYPVVHKLVGDACFRTLAVPYMRRYPSRSGDLQRFGWQFPAYLEHCYANSEYDYLSDVARLEWACEEVRTSPDAGSLNLGGLAGIPQERYPELGFWLHPAHRIVSSRYPLLSIWQANQAADAGSVDLRAGGEQVLVLRRSGDIELHRVDPALAAFTQAIGAGGRLGDAYTLAAEIDPAFDPAAALIRLAGLNLLSGFFLATSNSPE